MIPVTLNQLREGEVGAVVANPCRSAPDVRLAELGLSAGAWVQVIRRGSPMVVRVGEARLCLRSESADAVVVLRR